MFQGQSHVGSVKKLKEARKEGKGRKGKGRGGEGKGRECCVCVMLEETFSLCTG